MINAKGASYKLNGADAIGFFIGEQFGVMNGAEVRPVKGSLRDAAASGYLSLRERLESEKKIEDNKLRVDYVFDSPSQAGDILLGTTGGGPEKWVNEDTHMSIREVRKQDKSMAVKISHVAKILILAIGIAVLFVGCGKRMDWDENSHSTIAVPGVDLLSLSEAGEYVNPNYADALYYKSYREGFEGTYRGSFGSCTACSKRKAALDMSREVWTYSFKGYIAMDGVSSLIYNVGYLCSIPHKVVRGLFCMDGVVCYIGALFKLALGAVCAAVGVVAQTVVGVIFHPFETIANLTIGVVGFDFTGTQRAMGLSYTKYIFHTNLIATLVDLIWGAIIYPLLQTVLFWL